MLLPSPDRSTTNRSTIPSPVSWRAIRLIRAHSFPLLCICVILACLELLTPVTVPLRVLDLPLGSHILGGNVPFSFSLKCQQTAIHLTVMFHGPPIYRSMAIYRFRKLLHVVSAPPSCDIFSNTFTTCAPTTSVFQVGPKSRIPIP